MKTKVEVPSSVSKLLQAYATAHDVTLEETIERLLSAVEMARRFHGNLKFLGEDWQLVSAAMQSSALERLAKQASSTPQDGGVVDLEPPLTEAQRKLLEPSDTLDSGYAGVYSNGAKGWRAQVRGADGRRRWLPARHSPEAAAWDYYQAKQEEQSRLGEGKSAAVSSYDATLAWVRKEHPDLSEDELKKLAEDMEKAIHSH
jgi:hypothetical protein